MTFMQSLSQTLLTSSQVVLAKVREMKAEEEQKRVLETQSTIKK